MKDEDLSKESIDNPNAEEKHELEDDQLDKVAGGAKPEYPDPGTEGSCPKSPNGGDHEWYLVNSWPDGRGGRWTGETWNCRRCGKPYNRFILYN